MNERMITTSMLTEYRQKLIEDEKSAATIDKYMHDVERFVSYCEDEGTEDVTKMTSISPTKTYEYTCAINSLSSSRHIYSTGS